jgi:hypothetical protein
MNLRCGVLASASSLMNGRVLQTIDGAKSIKHLYGHVRFIPTITPAAKAWPSRVGGIQQA